MDNLGLTFGVVLSRDYEDMLGMNLKIESEKDKGTTAQIVIPVQKTFSIS